VSELEEHDDGRDLIAVFFGLLATVLAARWEWSGWCALPRFCSVPPCSVPEMLTLLVMSVALRLDHVMIRNPNVFLSMYSSAFVYMHTL